MGILDNDYLDEEELQQQQPSAAPPPIDSGALAADPKNFLREYLANRTASQQHINRAEDTAESNRLFARLGQAAATAGSGIAKAPMPLDQTPFEGLVKDADRPVVTAERVAANQVSNDKLLQNYFLRQAGMNSREKIAEGKNDTQKDIAGTKSGDYNKRTDAMTDLGKGRLAISGAGLGLRQGAQAAQAAGAFNKDPVILTSSKQLAQIQKGLGRLDDVESGKVPFSSTIKADIEKDIANVISGGTSSSLGQLHRVEFNPYVERWQKTLDQMKGYQGDINAPIFRQQLRAQLSGLQNDIQQIQASRAQHLKKSVGTAYSHNPLAKQTVDENEKLYSEEKPAEKKPAAVGSGRKTVSAAQLKQYATLHYGGSDDAALKKARAFLGSQGYATE